jgi:hypothetical protein
MSFDLQLDLTQLTNLVIQLERDDIQTADALLVQKAHSQSRTTCAQV